mmetsp:Transcript_4470/g.4888  ORF Transcript_4470/g.4888 Transcript_4470/m.4888 type:complete len:195 (+) Transcript_4470:11-595(+)
MKHGALKITVVQGMSLTVKGTVGSSDPYVILRVGNKKARTKKATTINPVWKQTFIFNKITPRVRVSCECWDKHRIFDRFLGKFTIPVEDMEFATAVLVDKRYKLSGYKAKDRVGGEIQLQIVFASAKANGTDDDGTPLAADIIEKEETETSQGHSDSFSAATPVNAPSPRASNTIEDEPTDNPTRPLLNVSMFK